MPPPSGNDEIIETPLGNIGIPGGRNPQDLRILKKHLEEYHASGTSIHEEPDGSRFTVNDDFRKRIADLIQKIQ